MGVCVHRQHRVATGDNPSSLSSSSHPSSLFHLHCPVSPSGHSSLFDTVQCCTFLKSSLTYLSTPLIFVHLFYITRIKNIRSIKIWVEPQEASEIIHRHSFALTCLYRGDKILSMLIDGPVGNPLMKFKPFMSKCVSEVACVCSV